MMVQALDVAELFLAWANEDGESISNLRLQKLLYYAQAWYAVNYNRRLFDDPIEAWDYGPVVPDVYHEYKRYKSRPIPYSPEGDEATPFSQRQLTFLRDFYEYFTRFSAGELVTMTHNETPWKAAHAEGQRAIDWRAMRDFYTALYESQGGKEEG